MGYEHGAEDLGQGSRGDLVLEYIPWTEIHRAVVDIVSRIVRDGHSFDAIIAVAKGGFVPARIASDLLGVDDIGVISVRFYKRAGVKMAKPMIKHPLTIDVSGRSVLIVDDVVDSGRTLQLVTEEACRHGAGRVVSMALYVKPWATMRPDYFYKTTRSWVVFPWELLEVHRELGRGALDRLSLEEGVREKISEYISGPRGR